MAVTKVTNSESEKFISGIFRHYAQRRMPSGVMFELTHRCNFRCPHCYIKGSKKEKKELTTTQIFSILDQLKQIGVYFIGFTGGEPLIRKDIFAILERANKNGLKFSLLTNASLIGKKTVSRLKDLNVDRVAITLNGFSAGTFKAVTGANTPLSRVKSAIEALVKAKIYVKLKSTVLSVNVDELPLIRDYARSLGVPYGINPEILPQRNHSSKMAEYFHVGLERIAGLNKALFPEMHKGKPSRPIFNPKIKKLFNCDVGQSSFSISPYGKMNFCLNFEYPDYDILPDGLIKCWDKLKKDVDRLNKEKRVCAKCSLDPYCAWCPGRSYMESGEFNRCSEYLKSGAVALKNLEGAKNELGKYLPQEPAICR